MESWYRRVDANKSWEASSRRIQVVTRRRRPRGALDSRIPVLVTLSCLYLYVWALISVQWMFSLLSQFPIAIHFSVYWYVTACKTSIMATSPSPTSDHPLPLTDADPNTILRVASFNRAAFDLPIASVHPQQHNAVRSSLFQPFNLSPTPDLGTLTRLPFELLSQIILSLDLTSALRLSHTSRTAREILASVRAIRLLRTHALECVCVLLRSGLAAHTAVATLHGALTTTATTTGPACALCGAFGAFLFMPTATRCCLACLASAPDMRVGYLAKLADAAGVSENELAERVPVLRTLPARRRSVVTVRHALGSVLRGEGGKVEAAVGRWPDSLTLRLQAATALPWVDRVTGEAEPGVSCKGCQLALEGDYSEENLARRDRYYSREGFVRHVGECGPAAKLWEASRAGTVPVEEPKWIGLDPASTAVSVVVARRASQ